jgi:hypothetical protein
MIEMRNQALRTGAAIGITHEDFSFRKVPRCKAYILPRLRGR